MDEEQADWIVLFYAEAGDDTLADTFEVVATSPVLGYPPQGPSIHVHSFQPIITNNPDSIVILRRRDYQ